MSSNDKDKNPTMQQREERTTSPTPQTVMKEAEDHAKQNHSPGSCASLSLLEKVNSVACKYIRKSREAEKRAEAAEKALQEANERAEKAEKTLQETDSKLDKQRQQLQKLKLQFEAAKTSMAVLENGLEDLELDGSNVKSDNLESDCNILHASDEKWETFLSKLPKHDAQSIRDGWDKLRRARARASSQIPNKPASSSKYKMIHLMEYPEAFESFEIWCKMMEDDSWHDDDEWLTKNPQHPTFEMCKDLLSASSKKSFPSRSTVDPPERPIAIDRPAGPVLGMREQSKGLYKPWGYSWVKEMVPPSPSTSFQGTRNPSQTLTFPDNYISYKKLGTQGGNPRNKLDSTNVSGIAGAPAPADSKHRNTSIRIVPTEPEQKKEPPSTETDDQNTPKPTPLLSTPPTQPTPSISPPVAIKTPPYRSIFGPYSPVDQQPESSRHLDGSDTRDRNPRASIAAETPTPSPKKTKKDKKGEDDPEKDMLHVHVQAASLRAAEIQKKADLIIQRFRQNSREYEEFQRGLDAAIAPTLAAAKDLDEKEMIAKQNRLEIKILARPQTPTLDLGLEKNNLPGVQTPPSQTASEKQRLEHNTRPHFVDMRADTLHAAMKASQAEPKEDTKGDTNADKDKLKSDILPRSQIPPSNTKAPRQRLQREFRELEEKSNLETAALAAPTTSTAPKPNDLGNQNVTGGRDYTMYPTSTFLQPVNDTGLKNPAPHLYPSFTKTLSLRPTQEQLRRDRIMREHRQKQYLEQKKKALEPPGSGLGQEWLGLRSPSAVRRGFAGGFKRTASNTSLFMASGVIGQTDDEEDTKFWRKD